MCQGLNKLSGWNVVHFVMFVRNDDALMAVKKLYKCLSAARDTMYCRSLLAKVIHNGALSTLIRVQRLKRYGSAAVCIIDVIIEPILPHLVQNQLLSTRELGFEVLIEGEGV